MLKMYKIYTFIIQFQILIDIYFTMMCFCVLFLSVTTCQNALIFLNSIFSDRKVNIVGTIESINRKFPIVFNSIKKKCLQIYEILTEYHRSILTFSVQHIGFKIYLLVLSQYSIYRYMHFLTLKLMKIIKTSMVKNLKM